MYVLEKREAKGDKWWTITKQMKLTKLMRRNVRRYIEQNDQKIQINKTHERELKSLYREKQNHMNGGQLKTS